MNDSVDWKWKSLPYFALIRGPFARAGYQVATVARDGDLGHKVILLFSCREGAQKYAARRHQGFDDWKLGPLPTWEIERLRNCSSNTALVLISLPLQC